MKLTHQDLLIILQEGEGQKIEFKESFISAITQDMVAFANSTGGRVFIGVNDVGKVNCC